MTSTAEIAGSGPPDLRAAVLAELERIVDPCSQAIGKPIGLASMGVIERLDVASNGVSIRVLPTFPGCLFQGMFEDEIAKRIGGLPWCAGVKVEFVRGDVTWDESRMSAAARAKLRSRTAEAAPIPR